MSETKKTTKTKSKATPQKTANKAAAKKTAPKKEGAFKLAVIETGGKQYIIEPGKEIKVEKLPEPKNGEIKFDKVLLMVDGNGVKIGKPYIDGAIIEAEWTGEGRNKKVIVFKYHSKTRYRKKKGHRQHYTKVKVK